MGDERILPRLPHNCDVLVKNVQYRVTWWSNRTYEFADKQGNIKVKTEKEVQQLLLDKRIVKLNNGDADRV